MNKPTVLKLRETQLRIFVKTGIMKIITRINEKIADHISFKELNELKAEILQFQQLKQTTCETSS